MSRKESDEAFARGVVARVLDCNVRQLDVPGAAPRTPDAEILFSDGRRGLLEVTWLARRESLHLESRLTAIKHKLPNPGRWAWTANVGSVPEFDRFRKVYARLIELLEALDVDRVDELPPSIIAADQDLVWLAQSDTDFVRHRALPSSGRLRPVWVYGPGAVAVWDAEADVITPAVQSALVVEPAAGHLHKLLALDADERHLFFLVDLSGLSEEAVYELIEPHKIPCLPLTVPDGITAVWLCPGYGQTATRWMAGRGWELVTYA